MPTTFTKKKQKQFLEFIAMGVSMRELTTGETSDTIDDDTIGSGDEINYRKEYGFPSITVVNRYLQNNKDNFADRYRDAKEMCAMVSADEMIEIKNKVRRGEIDPYASKAIMESLKWSAERLAPHKYTPNMKLQGDKNNPIQVEHNHYVSEVLTVEQVQQVTAILDEAKE